MAKKDIEAPSPCLPYKWDVDLRAVYALKALQDGKADESQQKRVLKLILDIAQVHDLSYRPDSERDTAFAEGKRFVGLQILKLINLKPEIIEKAKKNVIK